MAYNSGTTPTLAELITGGFNPALFSKDTIMHTKSQLVAVMSCNNVWSKNLKKGYQVTIPVFSEGSTTEVTPGTEAAAQNLVGTAETLTVDHWEYAAAEISDMSEIENLADYMGKAAESCGYQVAKAMDTDVCDLFSGLNSSTVYGNDGQTMTDDIIVAIRESLRSGDVPDPGRWSMIGDPSTEADMYKIDKFVRNDYGANAVTVTGQIGRIYGMTVKITNNLTAATTGSYGVIMHPDAIGVVAQLNPRARTIPQPEKFRTLVVVDAIWGEDEIRDAFGYSFYTRAA